METTKTNYWKPISAILIFIILMLLFQKFNPGAGETVMVKIPEKAGKFESVKPSHTPIIHDTVIKWQKSLNKTNSPQLENDTVNERLLSENAILSYDYKIASDSLKAIKYTKAIQLNDFAQTFNNDTIKIDVFGKSRGTVEKLGVKWTIKPFKIPVTIKTWRVLASGELGANTQLSTGAISAGLIYQSVKGQQYSGKYARIGGQDYVMVGGAVTVFKHTK